MPSSIRLVYFTDLHAGMEKYGRLDSATGTSPRRRDFLNRLDEVIRYALDHKAGRTLFAADAFTLRVPEPTPQREFDRPALFRKPFREGNYPSLGNSVEHSTGGVPYRLKNISIWVEEQ